MQSQEINVLNSFLSCTGSPISEGSASEYKRLLADLGFSVFKSASADVVPILASTKSLLVSQKFWSQVVQKSGLVFSALEKTARWLARPEQSLLADRIYGSLTQLEKDAAFGLLEQSTGSATIRYDLFLTATAAKILEVNTTIPAMQAYSDMISEAHGKVFKSSQTGSAISNTEQLLRSLLAHFQLSGGVAVSKIAIVAREGDSQIGELKYYKEKWSEQGYFVQIVQPADLRIEGEKLRDQQHVYDLVYRHIFATGVEVGSDFYKALKKSWTYKVFNPVSGHLEVKGLLAELSRLAADSEMAKHAGISEVEVAAVNEMVPWTRFIDRSRFISKNEIDQLIARREQIVIKKSSGYGGHGVILGKDFYLTNVQDQVAKIMRREGRIEFSDFLFFCMDTLSEAWIVQDLVEGISFRNQVLADGAVSELTTFVDLSLFGSSGTEYRPNGAAARIGPHQIVNIGRGGGMMPVYYSP